MNIKFDQANKRRYSIRHENDEPVEKKTNHDGKGIRARFGDDDQCARYLARERWPNGFLCPRCGGRSRGYMASRRVEECADCGYQCSVTAGTIFHKTRVPLTGWFWRSMGWARTRKGFPLCN